jgi:hypothetical protein
MTSSSSLGWNRNPGGRLASTMLIELIITRPFFFFSFHSRLQQLALMMLGGTQGRRRGNGVFQSTRWCINREIPPRTFSRLLLLVATAPFDIAEAGVFDGPCFSVNFRQKKALSTVGVGSHTRPSKACTLYLRTCSTSPVAGGPRRLGYV